MSCEHYYPIVDQHEGTLVCSDCGFVLENVIDSNINFYSHTKSIDTLKSESSIFIEFLERLNAPENFFTECDFRLKTLYKKDKTENPEILGEILYSVLLKNLVPRTLKEIASVVGTSTNKLWKQLTLYQETTELLNIVNPIDITERACRILDLKFEDLKKIKASVKFSFEHFPSYHPSTIVGSCIYTHCKEAKKKKSFKEVARVLGIAPVTISRFLKKLHNET